MKTLMIIVCLIFLANVAGAQGPDRTKTRIIRNATVLTVSRGTLVNTDVLIRNGKIAAVGQNLKAPDDAQVTRMVEPSIFTREPPWRSRPPCGARRAGRRS